MSLDMTLPQANEILRKLLDLRAEENTKVLSEMYKGSIYHERSPAIKLVSFPQIANFILELKRADKEMEYVKHIPFWFGNWWNEHALTEQQEDVQIQGALDTIAKSMGFDPFDTARFDALRPQRFVVAAACKYGDTIFVGARHFSDDMRTQLDCVREERLIDLDNRGLATQGFVDAQGIFMDRKEAYQVAKAAGQLDWNTEQTGHDSERLYSEDLYGGSWWLVPEHVIGQMRARHEHALYMLESIKEKHGLEVPVPEFPEIPEGLRLRDLHEIHDSFDSILSPLRGALMLNDLVNEHWLRDMTAEKFYEDVRCKIAEVVATSAK